MIVRSRELPRVAATFELRVEHHRFAVHQRHEFLSRTHPAQLRKDSDHWLRRLQPTVIDLNPFHRYALHQASSPAKIVAAAASGAAVQARSAPTSTSALT